MTHNSAYDSATEHDVISGNKAYNEQTATTETAFGIMILEEQLFY